MSLRQKSGGGIVRQILVRGTILFLFFLQFVDFYNSGVKKDIMYKSTHLKYLYIAFDLTDFVFHNFC